MNLIAHFKKCKIVKISFLLCSKIKILEMPIGLISVHPKGRVKILNEDSPLVLTIFCSKITNYFQSKSSSYMLQILTLIQIKIKNKNLSVTTLRVCLGDQDHSRSRPDTPMIDVTQHSCLHLFGICIHHIARATGR